MSCLASVSFALCCSEVKPVSQTTNQANESRSYLRSQSFPWKIWAWLALVAALLFAGTLGARAQSPFTPTFATAIQVGTSASVTVSVTAAAAGTVDTIQVLTQGAAGQDFAASSTGASCASASLLQGQTCQQAVTFTPAYPGIRYGAVVLLGGGKVLGTTYISGMGLGGLPVLVNGNMVPVAGSGAYDELEDGDPATSADLNLPASVVLDGAGNMYIADSVHHRIRMVSSGNGATINGSVTYPAAGIITTIAGTGTAGVGADGAAAYTSALDSPAGLAVDGAGNLYIADTGNSRVRVISAATGQINTIAVGASLNQPWGVTIDAAGNLFIADTFNHRIVRVDAITQAVTTVAGTGTVPSDPTSKAGDGGPATSAQLSRPHAVAFDAVGNMYIPDTGDNRIRKVDTTGTITTFAGTGAVGFSADGTVATNVEMWAPSGVIVDVAQNVYYSDTQNNAIRKINATTQKVATVVQGGKFRNVFNNTLYTNSLYGPIGLALDGNGNLYIADYFYMRIREIQSNVGLLDFTSAAVRAGSTSTQPSTPAFIQVENDGNAALTLGAIGPVSNSAINAASTTCEASNSLAIDTACIITPQFAPTTSGNPLFGEVDVTEPTTNSPLAILLVGNATPINSTTTTLTSNHDPSNYGQSVMFTATVNTGAGTGALTGTVTFFDGSTTLQTNVHVTATSIPNTYTASFSTPGLTVGTHSITATYSGDNYHLATDPTMIPELTQLVNEATATTLSSSANPSALGSSVTFTAKVAISGGGGVVPDGMVNFNDGNNFLGSVALDGNGVASLSTASLTAGTHAITASYPGDTGKNILASSSSVVSQDVQAASTTVVQASPNPSTYGTSVSFTATVTTASGSAPTGTVTFLDGSTKIGTAPLAGTSGVAAFSTAALSAGSHAITASYAGDTNSGPGVSAPIIQVVNLISTVTSLSANPSPGIAGKPVVLTATVKGTTGSGAVTGTVTFSDGSKAIGSGKLNAAGMVSISPTLTPGAHAIVATYGGDSNDTASTSAALPLAVNLATTAVAVQSSASPAAVLSPVTFTATVTGNGGTPTGEVTFAVDGAKAGAVTLNASGEATFTDSSLKVGSHNITASYGGDADDAGSTSTTFSQAIQAIPTVTTLGQSSTSGNTPELILVAAITGSSGPTPTGTVTFMNGTQTIGAAPLDSTGVATLVPDLAPGSYNIVANYQGDADHSPSSSTVVKVSGTPVGFAITVDPPTLSLAASQNAAVTIKISSSNGYADTIGLGCGTLPAGITCHFNTPDVPLKAGQSASVQLTIDTNNPLGGGATAMNARPGSRGLSLAGLFLPVGLLFGSVLWRFRKRNAAFFGAVIVLLLSGAMFMTGCSGMSLSTAAPGTYTIQVTGVGTNSNITHYQNITLTITK
jgi:sugar lactone lactonase YvrE